MAMLNNQRVDFDPSTLLYLIYVGPCLDLNLSKMFIEFQDASGKCGETTIGDDAQI